MYFMKRLLKSGLIVSVLTFVTLPLSYVVRLILSRNLSLAEFGLFYAVIGFFDLIDSVIDLGFSEAQVYFIPKFLAKQQLNKVKAVIKVQLINQIVSTLAIGVVITFLAPWIATHVLHYPSAENLIRTLIIYFVVKDFLLNTRNVFFSFQEFSVFGALEVIRILLTTFLLGVSFFFFKFDLFVISWIWILVYSVLAVGYTALFLIKHKEIISAPHYPLRKVYGEFIPFVVTIFFSNGATVLYGGVVETLLAFFKGVLVVGLYNIAKPISNLANAVVSPVAMMLKPYISHISEQTDDTHVRKIISVILNTIPFLLLPLILTLILFAKESIVFLFGAQFTSAANTLRIIALDIFFAVFNLFFSSILFGLGMQKRQAQLASLSAIACLALSCVLIPLFGASGVAMANLLYSVITLVGILFFLSKKVSYKLPLLNYGKIAVLCAGYLILQSRLSLITSEETLTQLLIFLGRTGFSLVLYYLLGIFVFKIIDTHLVKELLRSALPTKKKWPILSLEFLRSKNDTQTL